MTLIEMMIASTIALIALSAVMALVLYSARAFAAITNYVDLDQSVRAPELVRIIRERLVRAQALGGLAAPAAG